MEYKFDNVKALLYFLSYLHFEKKFFNKMNILLDEENSGLLLCS